MLRAFASGGPRVGTIPPASSPRIPRPTPCAVWEQSARATASPATGRRSGSVIARRATRTTRRRWRWLPARSGRTLRTATQRVLAARMTATPADPNRKAGPRAKAKASPRARPGTEEVVAEPARRCGEKSGGRDPSRSAVQRDVPGQAWEECAAERTRGRPAAHLAAPNLNDSIHLPQ